MGYELHIVRNDEWWEEDAAGGIAFEEWSSLVEADESMRMDGFAEITSPDGTVLRIENKGLAVWTSYSGNVEGGNQAWFDFRNGGIVVKNPDQELLKKMLEIADALGAKIVGDEGEEYDTPNAHSISERETDMRAEARGVKPWWRFW